MIVVICVEVAYFVVNINAVDDVVVGNVVVW